MDLIILVTPAKDKTAYLKMVAEETIRECQVYPQASKEALETSLDHKIHN